MPYGPHSCVRVVFAIRPAIREVRGSAGMYKSSDAASLLEPFLEAPQDSLIQWHIIGGGSIENDVCLRHLLGYDIVVRQRVFHSDCSSGSHGIDVRIGSYKGLEHHVRMLLDEANKNGTCADYSNLSGTSTASIEHAPPMYPDAPR